MISRGGSLISLLKDFLSDIPFFIKCKRVIIPKLNVMLDNLIFTAYSMDSTLGLSVYPLI